MTTDYTEACIYSTKLLTRLASLDSEKKLDYSLIKKAIYWAKNYHYNQFRKSGEPFYSHPLEVAYMIADYQLKTDVLVASILHDIVEDTTVTVEMISDSFGWRIAEMVDRLTRDRPDGTKLSVEETLNHAYQQNDKEVLLIKLFDRLHNIQTLSVKSPDKIKKTTIETLNIFMVIAIFIGYKDLEQLMFQICCNNLSIDYIYDRNIQINDQNSYLSAIKTSYNHQLVAQVFQNVIDQK